MLEIHCESGRKYKLMRPLAFRDTAAFCSVLMKQTLPESCTKAFGNEVQTGIVKGDKMMPPRNISNQNGHWHNWAVELMVGWLTQLFLDRSIMVRDYIILYKRALSEMSNTVFEYSDSDNVRLSRLNLFAIFE